LGGVSGMIGKYLEQTLERLKARGGEWQQCGAVLESISRSSGMKATQSFDHLVRETGMSCTVLAEMLPVLINERLIRPVGHETYEIQHDRLAAAVIESMKDSDRKAKAAREFLAAKVPAFEWTMASLTPSELVYLYRHRQKIDPTERELQVLLVSMLHDIETRYRNESPGAYWFRKSLPQDFLRWFIQIEHWAAKKHRSLRPSHEWVKTIPLCGLESQFATLADDPVPSVRRICAQWIGRTKDDDDLPLLRNLAKDQDHDVRTAAMEALASFARPEALPLLRELAWDKDWQVSTAAVKALASLIKALGSFLPAEDLPLLRELAVPRHFRAATELAKDEGGRVSAAAMEALTSLIKAPESFSRAEDLPQLYELAKDRDSYVRDAAVEALGSFSRAEGLPLLRELAKDPDWRVSAAAVKALARFSLTEDLSLLRKLALEPDADVAAEAIRGIAPLCSREELETLLNQHDQKLCAGALAALDEALYMPEWLKAKDR
jgi:HEAT repeat protein